MLTLSISISRLWPLLVLLLLLLLRSRSTLTNQEVEILDVSTLMPHILSNIVYQVGVVLILARTIEETGVEVALALFHC